MKRYLLALAFFSYSCFTYCTSITVSGPVSGTWVADTVYVQGNLVIPAGEQLTINAGTLIQFKGYYRLDVYGSISAEGLLNDTILFTVRDTAEFHDQTHGRGGWSGIRLRLLDESQDSSIFAFCRFQFGKATEDSINCYGGAIFIQDFNKVRINDCLFYHNYSYYSGGAIYLREADIIVKECAFKSNYAGNAAGIIYGYGGGICSMYSSPEVSWNEFYDNSSTGVGGGASFDNSDPIFDFNTLKGNFSALGGALGVLRSTPVNTISNNLIYNNEALFFGGGVCCIRSFPVFSNLTIANNYAAYGGAFYCNDSAGPKMYNSILWGNVGFGQSVYIWDVFSAPSFYYCDIEGDTTNFEGSGAHLGYNGEYLNNINLSPDFYGSGMYPYMLVGTSPCIDNGTPDPTFLSLPETDLAGNARVFHNRIDMGVYEYNGTTRVDNYINNPGFLQAFPNPFFENLSIILPLGVNSEKLVIRDATGRLVTELAISSTSRTIQWNGCDFQGKMVPVGIYLIYLENSGLSPIKVIRY